MKDDKILTTTEVCDLLKTNKNTLYMKIRDKGLPAFKLGLGYRFSLKKLKEWMETQFNESSSKNK
ncbi:MAG: helix-turn-helix domain-containing protein [Deltaproteobacteria bacterium]|jgi:excisionase family DNA binding protein|nr:helix-turn-helix domain-containing protein [Deltaproteobacteria bacterium]